MLCPVRKEIRSLNVTEKRRTTDIFPTQRCAAFAAVDIPHCMITGCH